MRLTLYQLRIVLIENSPRDDEKEKSMSEAHQLLYTPFRAPPLVLCAAFIKA
jgi:hypothetical protein